MSDDTAPVDEWLQRWARHLGVTLELMQRANTIADRHALGTVEAAMLLEMGYNDHQVEEIGRRTDVGESIPSAIKVLAIDELIARTVRERADTLAHGESTVDAIVHERWLRRARVELTVQS